MGNILYSLVSKNRELLLYILKIINIYSFFHKYFIYLFLSIILICNSVYAQESKKHHIGFRLGFGHYSTRDNLVSPLMFSGNKAPLKLYYQYNGLENRHLITIFYNNGEIRSSVNNRADELAAGFNYGYHRNISSFLNNKGKIFIGGIWNNHFIFRNYFFKSYESSLPCYTDTDSWELVSSLSLSSCIEYYNKPKNRFIFQTYIPFIAHVNRPSYSLLAPDNINRLKNMNDLGIGDILQAGDIVTLNKYFLINLLLSYEISVSKLINLKWGYSFTYYRIKNPFKTSSIINELSMDLIIVL